MTSVTGRKTLGEVPFLRLPKVLAPARACRGARSMDGWNRDASPGPSRWVGRRRLNRGGGGRVDARADRRKPGRRRGSCPLN